MPQILPTALDQDLEYEDFYESTLKQPLSAADTDIYVTNLPMSAAGLLVIDAEGSSPEIVFFNEKGSDYVRVPSSTDGEGRGVFNTVPGNFDEGTKIGMYTIAAFFEALATGKAMRNGFLEARHFSSSVDPNNWTGLGVGLTYGGTNGNHESYYTYTGDLTPKLWQGMKLQLPRVTNIGYKCADFESSSSQYATKTGPSNILFTDDCTAEAWVKLESLTGNALTIITRTNGSAGWGFEISTTGNVSIFGATATGNYKSVTSIQALPLNKWVHVAATLDMSSFTSATNKVFIDGIDVPATLFSAGTNPTALTQAGDLFLGMRSSTNYMDGKMYDVRLWSEIRTQSQIRSNKDKRLVGNETNLVSYFKLTDNFNDSTANNNHLTAMGSVTATSVDAPFATTEYAIVTKCELSGGVTTITMFTGEGNAPAENLSNVSYSSADSPYGFPTDKGKWRLEMVVRGPIGFNAAVSTWQGIQNATTLGLTVPTGSWKIGYSTSMYIYRSAGAPTAMAIGLSSGAVASDGSTIIERTVAGFWQNSPTEDLSDKSIDEVPFTVTSPTALVIAGVSGSASSMSWLNTTINKAIGIVYAECAYL